VAAEKGGQALRVRALCRGPSVQRQIITVVSRPLSYRLIRTKYNQQVLAGAVVAMYNPRSFSGLDPPFIRQE